MTQCVAITSSGKRCTREATHGDDCWQHSKSTKRASPKRKTLPSNGQKEAWFDWLEIASEEMADYGVEEEDERRLAWALSTPGTSKEAKRIIDAVTKDVGAGSMAALKRVRSEVTVVDKKYFPFPQEAIQWQR